MNKQCLGLVSVFAIDSQYCKECKHYDECLVKTYESLVGMGFEQLTARHREAMARKQITIAPDVVVKKKERTFAKAAIALSKQLNDEGLIGKGWISECLSTTPQSFQVVVESLDSNQKVFIDKLSKLLVSLYHGKVNAKQYAIEQLSIAVQVLIINEIVDFDEKDNSIKKII